MSHKTRKRARTVSSIFLQGLAITLPITLTLAMLYWLAATAENFLGGLIQSVFPYGNYWTGMGILLAIVLIFIAGILMNVWITRRLLARIDALLDRIPLVKSIYGSIRDIAGFLSKKDSEKGFQQVVAVSLTDQIRLVGFVTVTDVSGASLKSGASDSLVGVYLPMSYQIGGYTIYLPRSRIEPLDMTIEDALRFTLTAGMSGKRSRAS
ncbi:MAG: DUF502 domain-containing protein [Betaproteobacteria bacterium]|nr:DUF502 domain-containing protein [Betaproteobacteria bacterium]MDH3438089.1 DUF502 domain-containing protein [Betaproteobacteria bacterium]